MEDFLTVTGMILKIASIGEYDKRIVILTKEKGKIAAFAKGARRQNSRFMAAASPFSFGEFKLYASKNSYNLMDVSISQYFTELRQDFEGAYYGMFFLEMMDYFTRENNDEKEMLKLLYQSLRALQHKEFSKGLVRYIFEVKILAVNGEFPGVPSDRVWLEDTLFAIQFIVQTPIEKLYTFRVSEAVLLELKEIANRYRKQYYDREFQSLTVLETLGI